MAGEGDGKIFFLPKKKKPPDERITGETADEKATSDSTVRQLPTRRRCTNDQRVPTTHACDQEVRRPLATAENATDAAATDTAAEIKTLAANAPTDPQTLLGIRGIAPSVYPRPGMCCRRVTIGSRSGDEWGLRWELAVGGVPWRRPKAPPLSLPPPQPLPSRQWQPTHQLTHRHSRASRVSHPPFTRGLELECAADEL